MKGASGRAVLFRVQFGARFAPSKAERQVGETGARALRVGRRKTRPKLLKTERLEVFQFDPKLPSFG
jgi:hypothetical protein